MPKLYYQGHGSFRLTADDNRVIYIDPFAGDGYGLPAALILVTHAHRDHCQTQLCAQAPGCRVITQAEALAGGRHNRFEIGGIIVEAVEAGNLMHNPAQCVGYIITLDGISLYAAGDTSQTAAMAGFAARGLDYALLPCDGVFNMNPKEAAACAKLINAKHSIPIHMKPGALFSEKAAEKWDAPNKLVVRPGAEITL